MNILVTGKGGREHAILSVLHRNPGHHTLFCYPGSDAIRGIAPTPNVANLTELADWMTTHNIHLCIAGEETYLVEDVGLAQLCAIRNIPCWGPHKDSAQLEASKEFAKDFMTRHGIPTATYATAGHMEEAVNLLPHSASVLKFDGLAAGKGVAVCSTRTEALAFLREIFEDNRFGYGRVVIEECLTGPEISIFTSIVDQKFHWLMSARDYKRIRDNDEGPNTGGMGAVASSEIISPQLRAEIEQTIIQPTVNGLIKDGLRYRGFLYFGLMLTPDGPKLLEYNCRFGDPEAEAVLPMLKGDFATYLAQASAGDLQPDLIEFNHGWSTCVILASAGYPESSDSGHPISGLENVTDAHIFHCGTQRGPNGWENAGGRVLAVTAGGSTLTESLQKVTNAQLHITFEGSQRRTDIGRLHFEP